MIETGIDEANHIDSIEIIPEIIYAAIKDIRGGLRYMSLDGGQISTKNNSDLVHNLVAASIRDSYVNNNKVHYTVNGLPYILNPNTDPFLGLIDVQREDLKKLGIKLRWNLLERNVDYCIVFGLGNFDPVLPHSQGIAPLLAVFNNSQDALGLITRIMKPLLATQTNCLGAIKALANPKVSLQKFYDLLPISDNTMPLDVHTNLPENVISAV